MDRDKDNDPDTDKKKKRNVYFCVANYAISLRPCIGLFTDLKFV